MRFLKEQDGPEQARRIMRRLTAEELALLVRYLPGFWNEEIERNSRIQGLLEERRELKGDKQAIAAIDKLLAHYGGKA